MRWVISVAHNIIIAVKSPRRAWERRIFFFFSFDSYLIFKSPSNHLLNLDNTATMSNNPDLLHERGYFFISMTS